jgi:hypothetical protein
MHRTALLLVVLAGAFAQSGYHQLKKDRYSRRRVPGLSWPLTALPGPVFVSHGTEVDVVDSKKGEVKGKIIGAW